MFENRTEAEIKYLRKTMGSTKNYSCDIEFNKDFKEYPEYGHFNFAMLVTNSFNKSGVLPFPGSFSEQPAQIIDIIETIMTLDGEREADAIEKAKKNNGK